jgi:DNA-directed RNA polymerase subunit A"
MLKELSKKYYEIPEDILRKVERISKTKKLSREQKKKLLVEIKRRFERAKFEPGEAIGIITAQSISEPATQMTMRTFHFAGSAGVQVTLGLPRLIEIFDAKKTPETPTMVVYLKSKYNNRKDAKAFAEKIRERKLSSYAVKVVTNFSKLLIKIKLRKGLRKEIVDNIMNILKKNLKELKIKKEKDYITIIVPKETDIRKLYKLKKKIMNLHISGIKDIKNVIIRKEGKNWVINTIGSNLEKILTFDEVDVSKTRSNDIHETQAVLGIEAARSLIIREALETLKQQGLNVDLRHIMLVADIMTFSGKVKAIGRYGVAGAKTSVLSRAAFEETIKHLTKAAVKNEKDRLTGIFENVMIGQVVPSGTGLFELIAKFEEEK